MTYPTERHDFHLRNYTLVLVHGGHLASNPSPISPQNQTTKKPNKNQKNSKKCLQSIRSFKNNCRDFLDHRSP